MKKKDWIRVGKIFGSTGLILTISLGLAGCGGKEAGNEASTKAPVQQTENKPNSVSKAKITIPIQEISWELKPGMKVPAWAYNGTIPGKEIRVKEGEWVEAEFSNDLPESTSIHWHGYPVPAEMDGIPGITMSAIKPGESYTYRFQATVPGTYWYHSHQKSAEQVDMGLYGTLIVEPKEDAIKADREYVLVLDEWSSGAAMANDQGHSNSMPGMNHGSSNASTENHMAGYDLVTVNGKAEDGISALTVKKGEMVRLRFINAGYIRRTLHFPGHHGRIITYDGQPVKEEIQKDPGFTVAPGERVDMVFLADQSGEWKVEEIRDDEKSGAHNMTTVDQVSKPLQIPIRYDGEKEGTVVNEIPAEKMINRPSLPEKYNLTYSMTFTENMVDENGAMQTVYPINGERFPNVPPLTVKKGDWIKVTMKNESKADHPMHLHGHFFRVIKRNGQPIENEVWKDTILLKPDETVEVAFQADNPGNWLFHCHDLHHASSGMVAQVNYEGYEPPKGIEMTEDDKPE